MSDEELVYKTVYNAPAPQPSAAPIVAGTQAQWDACIEAHIANALHDHKENYLNDFLAEIIALMREEMHEHVEKKLGELRTEVKAGNVEQLVRKNNVA